VRWARAGSRTAAGEHRVVFFRALAEFLSRSQDQPKTFLQLQKAAFPASRNCDRPTRREFYQ